MPYAPTRNRTEVPHRPCPTHSKPCLFLDAHIGGVKRDGTMPLISISPNSHGRTGRAWKGGAMPERYTHKTKTYGRWRTPRRISKRPSGRSHGLRPTICNRPTSVSPITAFDPGSARGSRTATSKQRSSTWCCRVPAGSSSNEDILEVAPLDAFRVAPKVLRTWEARSRRSRGAGLWRTRRGATRRPSLPTPSSFPDGGPTERRRGTAGCSCSSSPTGR